MKFDVFRDILLLPGEQPSLAHTYEAFAAPNKLPRFCRHKRGGRYSTENPKVSEIRCEDFDVLRSSDTEQYVFGGYICHHFGHFISEYVHRLWLFSLPAYAEATAVFLSSTTDTYVQPFFEQLMHYFGVKKWKILHKPTRVPKLTIAEAGQFLEEQAKPQYLSVLACLFKEHQMDNSSTPKKVAITRGHLGRGCFLGEAGFEQYLEKEGYAVFRPEEHTILDQLKVVANADKIIISEGSACHLFDLLPPLDCDVAFLARRPNTRIDQTSITGKVQTIKRYDKAALLMAPTGEKGVALNAAGMSFIDYQDLANWLRRGDFTKSVLPDLSAMQFQAELTSYVSSYYGNSLDEKTEPDMALHILLREVLAQSNSHQDKGVGSRIVESFASLGFKRMS